MDITIGRVQITKRKLLLEVSNTMCHNYYYEVVGRVYHENGHTYRRFNFVVFFDIFDLQEYFEKDIIHKKDIKEYLDYLIEVNLYMLNGWDDSTEFFEMCKESVDKYNNSI